MVSLMPRYWRSAPASMIHSAPTRAPARQTRAVPKRLAGKGSACAVAAQAMPPSTSAPSPPITTRPARAGRATHSAVSISGAARCRLFCQENQSPNAPLNSVSQTSSGFTPASATRPPNSNSAPRMAHTGSSKSLTVLDMVRARWVGG